MKKLIGIIIHKIVNYITWKNGLVKYAKTKNDKYLRRYHLWLSEDEDIFLTLSAEDYAIRMVKKNKDPQNHAYYSITNYLMAALGCHLGIFDVDR